jgi:hypothetical protein
VPSRSATGNYRRQRALLKAEGRRRNLPCWLCGQPIDYDAPHLDPGAFSLDHIKLVSTHPWLKEDTTNHAPAHRRCNLGRGNRAPTLGLGEPSRDW